FTRSLALAAPARVSAHAKRALDDGRGGNLGEIAFSDKGMRLTVRKADADSFLAFLEREIPALVARFNNERDG
ncbi:MAG: hypothetical protein ACRC7G_05730, partial [Beijerinckiaceae bacterium]